MAVISQAVRNMPRIDGILVTVTNYTYNPGSVNIRKQLTDEGYRDFLLYMAEVMVGEFKQAIEKQRYKTGSRAWKPLTIKYYTWKSRNQLSLNIWEATGTLKNEIKVFKKGTYLAVGFRLADYYPGSSLGINKVARYMEFGTFKMPARPLFRPVLVHLRKNVSRYYKKYQAELKKSGQIYLYL